MINIKNVSVEVGGRTIIRSVNALVPEGKVTCIIGPNGAGKSTLLKALSKLLGYRGSILIDGHELSKTPRRALTRLLFYVQPINAPQALNLTVLDALMIAQHGLSTGFLDRKESYNKAINVARELGFEHLLLRRIDELSAGELQRVVLALGLIRQPKYIFFDEIDLHVDVGFKRKLVHLINSWKLERTIILTTHDLAFGTIVGDHFILMNRGEILYQGPIDGLISRISIVENVFNAKVLTFSLNGRQIMLPVYI